MDAWMHAQIDEWISGGWADGQDILQNSVTLISLSESHTYYCMA